MSTTPHSQLTLIARGNGSSVYTYGSDPSQSVILKAVPSSAPREQSHLRNEYSLLKELDHPHLVRALRYQERVALGNPKDKQSLTHSNILVLEFAAEGSLLHFLNKRKGTLPPGEKRDIFQQISEGVEYMHELGIAHRDLKLENILMFQEDGEIVAKVSDLGFATRFRMEGQEERLTFREYKGTIKGYMAPEIHACHKTPAEPYEADRADVFALGVILFAMVVGTLPFQLALEENKLYKLIKEGKFEEFWTCHQGGKTVEQEEGIRWEEFKEIFQRMVAFDPKERPSVKEVLKCAWMV